MFYFAASGIASWQAFGYIWIIILGNSVGGLLIPALQLLGNVTFKRGKNASLAPAEPASAAELCSELASDVTQDSSDSNGEEIKTY